MTHDRGANPAAAAHRQLDSLWQLHSEAIVERRWAIADAVFDEFAAQLELHLEVEERELFTHHDRYCAQPRWRSAVYRSEHDKLRRLLAKLQH